MFQFSLNLKDYLNSGREMRLHWKSSPRPPRVMLTTSRVHTEYYPIRKTCRTWHFRNDFYLQYVLNLHKFPWGKKME